jgi:hypothetical protein
MNFYGIFIRDFKFIRGAIIKSNVQNSKKQVKNEKTAKKKVQAQREMDPGSSKRIRSVGLIQLHQTLDLMVKMQGRLNQGEPDWFM